MPEITQLLYVFQVKDRKVENMAIVLTNGNYYIAHSNTGALIKVTDIKQAQDFHSVERAIQQRNKHPGKCAGYYFIDTALVDIIESKVVVNVVENKEKQSTKRRKGSQDISNLQGKCAGVFTKKLRDIATYAERL